MRLLRPDTWEATQALIIRNEAAGNSDAPGKFRHEDEMKTLLETVLELAKSRSVLAQTLEEVGPPADRSSTEAWPSDEEIVQFSEAFKIVAPQGCRIRQDRSLLSQGAGPQPPPGHRPGHHACATSSKPATARSATAGPRAWSAN